MIILKFIFFVLGVIFFLGLLGGLVMVIAMYRLRKRLEKTFKDAQQHAHHSDNNHADDNNEYTSNHGNLDDVNMVQCPHCGTFTPTTDPLCEHCGKQL